MRQKLPTIFIMMVMVLMGAMFWLDLSYNTDPVTGFITRGPLWARYVVLALPLLMALLGLRTVGPKAISVLRVKNRALGVLFIIAAVVGLAYGGTRIIFSINPLDIYSLVLGLLMLWYGVWMFLAALQLIVQYAVAPTPSAIWGVLAALPYCMITINRILVKPSSLYRVGPLVWSFAALFAMLWFGMLLRSLYIALPRRRVQWTYMIGLATFLFATCLDLPMTFYMTMFFDSTAMDLLESVTLATFGLVAGCVSVAIAAKSDAQPPPRREKEAQPVPPSPEDIPLDIEI